MRDELAGKIAIVTGTSGIALATIKRLAEGGAYVAACGIDPAANQAAVAATDGLDVAITELDLTDDPALTSWIEGVIADKGGIDILVNCAGIQTYGDIETTTPEHWDRVMAVNLRACYMTSHLCAPSMRERGGGAIIHVASVQGYANQNKVLAYATAKGAQHVLTRAMAVDCAQHGIRVNSVSPGSVRTPILELSARELDEEGVGMEEMIRRFGLSHPIGRVAQAEEVAEVIAFLAGPRSSFCAGADFVVDGALLAGIGV